ncbi:MAG: hypothetical protein K2Q06_14220, partial [Parvularculaceae bacterium]|nr:hypothetical protein [Parvularculaceae bacterium]
YFAPGSLARLFRRAGFDVVDIAVEYGDQYLTIEARPLAPGAAPSPPLAIEESVAAFATIVDSFSSGIDATLRGWRDRLDAARRDGKKVVLWGSGSKAVAFLTTLGLDDHVAWVTDINPHRHGCFMPKTGQEIVPPKALTTLGPDIVVVMNAVYVDEIRNDLAAMGLSPEILSL